MSQLQNNITKRSLTKFFGSKKKDGRLVIVWHADNGRLSAFSEESFDPVQYRWIDGSISDMPSGLAWIDLPLPSQGPPHWEGGCGQLISELGSHRSKAVISFGEDELRYTAASSTANPAESAHWFGEERVRRLSLGHAFAFGLVFLNSYSGPTQRGKLVLASGTTVDRAIPSAHLFAEAQEKERALKMRGSVRSSSRSTGCQKSHHLWCGESKGPIRRASLILGLQVR